MTFVRRIIPLIALVAACNKEAPLPVYQAEAIGKRDIVVTAQAAGAILPDTVVQVKSKASGEVLDIRVETGQQVERGMLMVRIDRRVPQNRVAQAQAQYDVALARMKNAESVAGRSKELFAARAITEQEYEVSQLDVANQRAQVIQTRVELENAKIALYDTNVMAPMNGTIIRKSVERGAVISSPTNDVGGGTVLLTMADLTLVQVKTFVDETDIGKLRPGMSADVTVEAFPNRPFRGEVLKIEPQADTIQNVTMFPVLVRIPNADGMLKPGMNAEVKINVGRADDVIAVPNAALRTERDATSAGTVLGIAEDELEVMLADARTVMEKAVPPADTAGRDTMARGGASGPSGNGAGRAAAPAGAGAIPAGMQAGGGNGGQGRGRTSRSGAGGQFIVFVLRGGKPTPVYIRTGITDLDYTEVKSGLAVGDSVLMLPSASLIQSQKNLQERMGRNAALPGQGSATPAGGRRN
ncbi:MAG: efflux RND transporter periplasmic adaptor subunit [Gemmatimonadales bacterium]|nr:efflux RND transporter periplasmic adaptor subunit [Gemmatimonadales bacterium]